ncbi:MAG: AraC family transcriptional regulator [Bacteroidales bacterium]|nr:AraC family transcriptional regulator [Bacteroidales bacterium]
MANKLIYTTVDGNMQVEHYSDHIHLCRISEGGTCNTVVRENMLVYVYSGEVDFMVGGHTTTLRPGGTYLLRRNHKAQKRAHTGPHGEPMEGMFIYLPQRMMRRLAQELRIDLSDVKSWGRNRSFVLLPENPMLDHFFASLRSYFSYDNFPSEKLFDVRVMELVLTVLEIKPELKSVLFDFTEIGKIDIAQFMENNYTSVLSLNDYAHFTGRSLSAFKKEFSEIYGMPPMRWIIERRLEEAHRLITAGRKPKDVYTEVGFKNLSHFSKAFKQKFGIAPSEVCR